MDRRAFLLSACVLLIGCRPDWQDVPVHVSGARGADQPPPSEHRPPVCEVGEIDSSLKRVRIRDIAQHPRLYLGREVRVFGGFVWLFEIGHRLAAYDPRTKQIDDLEVLFADRSVAGGMLPCIGEDVEVIGTIRIVPSGGRSFGRDVPALEISAARLLKTDR